MLPSEVNQYRRVTRDSDTALDPVFTTARPGWICCEVAAAVSPVEPGVS